jgi:hypothetical protein
VAIRDVARVALFTDALTGRPWPADDRHEDFRTSRTARERISLRGVAESAEHRAEVSLRVVRLDHRACSWKNKLAASGSKGIVPASSMTSSGPLTTLRLSKSGLWHGPHAAGKE